MESKAVPQLASVAGIGIDIQSIPQFGQSLERQGERLIAKVFTPQESEYCRGRSHAVQHYAARWAVKEAFCKAVGGQLGMPFRFTDVEIRLTPQGRPYLALYNAVRVYAERHGLDFQISLSHSGDYATGIVLATRQAGGRTEGGAACKERCQAEGARSAGLCGEDKTDIVPGGSVTGQTARGRRQAT